MGNLGSATSTHDAPKADPFVVKQQQQQQQQQPPGQSTLSDDDSDTEEDVFSDAPDYIRSNIAISVPHVTVDLCVSSEIKPLWKRVSHNVNTILLTIGMLTGLTLAYLQWRQQAWSNQMSSIQTCLAMEQTTTLTSNSSFCQSILQKGIRRPRSINPENRTESLLEALTPTSFIHSTPLNYGLVLIGGGVAIFIFSQKLVSRMQSCPSSATAADDNQSNAPVHVPIHVPRLMSTSVEYSDVDVLSRRLTSVPRDENEHLYYLKAQATLAQEMRVRALSWQLVESSDRDDSALEWQNTGVQRNLWNEHLEANHFDEEEITPDGEEIMPDEDETTPDRPLSPHNASESQQATTTASHNHDIPSITHESSVEDEPARGKRLRKSKLQDMLSSALNEANRAISHDNAREISPAIEAYTKARDILQQVMNRTANVEDRKKLQAIKNTYSTRLWELIDPNANLMFDFAPPADGPAAEVLAPPDGAERVGEDFYGWIDDVVSGAYEPTSEPEQEGLKQQSTQDDDGPSLSSLKPPHLQPELKPQALNTLVDLPLVSGPPISETGDIGPFRMRSVSDASTVSWSWEHESDIGNLDVDESDVDDSDVGKSDVGKSDIGKSDEDECGFVICRCGD